jgi:dethiobiotin synthetase
MSGAIYLTGTDTGVGKTWVTAALVRGLRRRGVDAVGMKPVASGCERTPTGWRNEDALALLAAADLPDRDYGLVNPVALEMPASPHIAAAAAGVRVELAQIADAFATLRRRHACVLVEGVGGWLAPLAGPPQPWWLQADLVRALTLPVLLVVGLRLGCISHALLTARVVADDGCALRGWIGNALEPAWSQAAPVLDTVRALLPAPHAGDLGFRGEAPDASLDAVLAAMAG